MNNNILILGKNIYTATTIELIDAINTDAAEQSLQICANLLKFLPTIRSTNDSIEVFNISKIKTENMVAITTICSKLLIPSNTPKNNIVNPHKT